LETKQKRFSRVAESLKMWTELIQRDQNGQPVSDEERRQERDKMVDVLNRRNYIAQSVRDVSKVLEG